ncbi:MAG: acyltransferase [Oligoflexales bacterium]
MYTIEFVFEYKGQLDLDNFERALRDTEKLIPVVTARIKAVSDKRLEFHLSNEPVPLSVQNEDEGGPLLDPISNVIEKPLVKIRVTQSANMTRVGVSFSHMLGDGASFFVFMNTLAKCARREPSAMVVSHDRLRLFPSANASVESVPASRLFRETGYTFDPPVGQIGKAEILKFSCSDLAALKDEAGFEDPNVTTNDALMAYLLKRFHSQIPVSEEGGLIVRCPVDCRRFSAAVPNGYFGNAIRDAVACFDPDVFPHLTLSAVASKVREAISAVNERSFSTSLHCLEDLRQERGVDFFQHVGCPGLLVSNLSRLSFDSLDIGLGGPTQVYQESAIPNLASILAVDGGAEIKFSPAVFLTK